MARSILHPRRRAHHRVLLGGVLAVGTLAAGAAVAPDAQAVTFVRTDLDFILDQIKVAEQDAATPANDLASIIGNPQLPRGLRTIRGTQNNITPAGLNFGASLFQFPRLLTQVTRSSEPSPGAPFPPATQLDYAPSGPGGLLYDSRPRTISNLIVDQTNANPSAAAAKVGNPSDDLANDPNKIPNVAPDVGLSAPFNSWFTLFGQFFDHGLDLVAKGGAGTVIVPLRADDPLLPLPPGAPPMMVLTRATGAAEHVNLDSPFIDQSQTYSSHPSHQVFLREYELNAAGDPVANGRVLEGVGGLASWAEVKAQARDLLGIQLVDADVTNVPRLVTDEYGRFTRGPNGFPLIVTPGQNGGTTEGDPTANGGLGVPVPTGAGSRTGIAFLDDIAHNAAPGSLTAPKAPDTNAEIDAPAATLVPAGSYDDELLNAHFIAGDGRANENIGLTAVHFVFHAEHNRLVQHIKNEVIATGDAAFIAEWQLAPGVWNGERLFQAAKLGTEMQYQHLAFEEFARKVAPDVHVFAGYDTTINPAIVAEFAHTVYRFGHSMLTERVDRAGVGPIGLIEAFLNPVAFTASGATPAQAAGNIAAGMATQTGNELDEFVTEALRNNLVGLPLDLATLNLARGRETRVPGLNQARQELTDVNNAGLTPYASWAEFGNALRHSESLVNFVGAYGIHASLTPGLTLVERRAAATALLADATFMNAPAAGTGVNDVDFWIGGLAERPVVGQMLGPTFNFVFQHQMEQLQDGDRLYYLHRLAGTNFLTSLEENSFAEMIMRNTAGVQHLPADAFSRPDFVIERGDPATWTAANPDAVLVGGQLQYNGGAHVVMGGTNNADNMRGGIGDDSLWGDGGNDTLQGQDGVDSIMGGPGNDNISDSAGVGDTLKGNEGDDVVRGGNGLDLLLPGSGNDFAVAGIDGAEVLAGAGRDFVLGNNGADAFTGGEQDDWLEGAGGPDTLVGGNATPLHLGTGAGDDVMNGGAGIDALDGEGGDDIVINSPEADSNEGLSGFDWMTHVRDTAPATSDLNVVLPPVNPLDDRDRFVHTEGLSGSPQADNLKGSDAPDPTDPLSAPGQNDITNPPLIGGLKDVLDMRAGPSSPIFSGAGGNNIILGGGGADLMEGRGGNDLIDGDAQLNVTVGGQNGLAALQAGIQPNDIAGLQIARSITLVPGAGDVAVFSGPPADYEVTNANGGARTITHARGSQADGTDTVRNVEALQFAGGQTIQLDGTNIAPSGTLDVSDTTPTEGQALTAIKNFTDLDGIKPGSLLYSWEAEIAPNSDTWAAVGPVNSTFTPGDAEVGRRLRAIANYTDTAAPEQAASVISTPTAAVANVNDPATGAPVMSDTTPVVGQLLTASPGSIADPDGIAGVTFTFQWQAGDGTTWANVGTGSSFTPNALHGGSLLRLIASFTDNRGTAESRTSAATSAIPVPPPPPPPPPPPAATPPPPPAATPPPPPPAASQSLLPTGASVTPPVAPTGAKITSFRVSVSGAKKPFAVSFVLNAPATVQFEIRRFSDDALVRRIVHANKNGKVTLRWNRLDSKGRRAATGRYRVNIIATANGFETRVSRVFRLR